MLSLLNGSLSLELSPHFFLPGFPLVYLLPQLLISFIMFLGMASLVAQRLKRLLGMRETQVRSLGREDPWRRKWQSTPVLLPGESHGGRSLVGYSPRGHKESDTTERLHFHFLHTSFSSLSLF